MVKLTLEETVDKEIQKLQSLKESGQNTIREYDKDGIERDFDINDLLQGYYQMKAMVEVNDETT